MKKEYFKYLDNEGHYLREIETVWIDHFESREQIYRFFNNINSEYEKDLFLRIGSFYKYLVIEGSFCFKNKKLTQGMSYVDETYKYISIISLIEAVETPAEYKDFYQWLQKQKDVTFPISKKPAAILDDKYKEYKKIYGSTQATIRFFDRLDDQDKELLEKKLNIKGKELSINELAKILYDMRSKFVHSGKLILGFSPIMTLGYYNGKIMKNDLSIEDLCFLFERGFIKRFNK